MYKKVTKLNIIQFLLFFFAVSPVLTYSANSAPTNFKDAIYIVVGLITSVIPVIVLVAFIYFLWGLSQYLKNTGENRDDAKQMMISGIIGFFVMISVWGLVAILSSTLGTGTDVPTSPGNVDYLRDDRSLWDSLGNLFSSDNSSGGKNPFPEEGADTNWQGFE